jgi:hypothetical protein
MLFIKEKERGCLFDLSAQAPPLCKQSQFHNVLLLLAAIGTNA